MLNFNPNPSSVDHVEDQYSRESFLQISETIDNSQATEICIVYYSVTLPQLHKYF